MPYDLYNRVRRRTTRQPTSVDPNVGAMAMAFGRGIPRTQGRLPEFTGGQGANPNLLAMMVSMGMLPSHVDTQGKVMLPNAGPRPSMLDNQSFPGLDAYKANQPLLPPSRAVVNQPHYGRVPTTGADYDTLNRENQSLLPPARLDQTAPSVPYDAVLESAIAAGQKANQAYKSMPVSGMGQVQNAMSQAGQGLRTIGRNAMGAVTQPLKQLGAQFSQGLVPGLRRALMPQSYFDQAPQRMDAALATARRTQADSNYLVNDTLAGEKRLQQNRNWLPGMVIPDDPTTLQAWEALHPGEIDQRMGEQAMEMMGLASPRPLLNRNPADNESAMRELRRRNLRGIIPSIMQTFRR